MDTLVTQKQCRQRHVPVKGLLWAVGILGVVISVGAIMAGTDLAVSSSAKEAANSAKEDALKIKGELTVRQAEVDGKASLAVEKVTDVQKQIDQRFDRVDKDLAEIKADMKGRWQPMRDATIDTKQQVVK